MFLFPGLPALLIESEYSVGPLLLTEVLFGGLFVVYGIVVSGVSDLLAGYWPRVTRRILPTVVLAFLVFPALLGVLLGLLALGWHD